MPPEVEELLDSADGLTAGERAYLESGGENADGFLAEEKVSRPPETPEKPAGAAAAAEPPKTPEQPKPSGQAPQAAQEAKGGEEEEDLDPATGKPPATVPYQKYSRETKKARDRQAGLERQLSELQDKFARGDERLRLLSEVMTQPAATQQEQNPDPEPDYQKDIYAWVDWSRREQSRLRDALIQTRNYIDGNSHQQNMRESYQQDAIAFAQKNPDFGYAYNHLLNARALMLQEQGHDEESIRNIVFNEERGLVERAYQQNKSPAAMIYAMAKRMGYQGPPQPPAQAQPANGAAAQPGAQPAAKSSAVEEVERIKRGQEASKSLAGIGSGAASELSVEALAEMSDRDFEALYHSKKSQIESLLGQRS